MQTHVQVVYKGRIHYNYNFVSTRIRVCLNKTTERCVVYIQCILYVTYNVYLLTSVRFSLSCVIIYAKCTSYGKVYTLTLLHCTYAGNCCRSYYRLRVCIPRMYTYQTSDRHPTLFEKILVYLH